MRQFILLQIASITSIVAGSMMFLTLPWLTVSITGSSASAGLLIALTSLPGLILSPVLGSFVDRFGRRRVAIATEAITIFTTAAYPLWNGFSKLDLTMLVVLGIVRALFSNGSMTARKSLLPDVARVARMSLERANSIHESVAAASFATGPALASVIIATSNPMNAFWVCAGIGGLSAVFASFIHVKEFIEDDSNEREGQSFVQYAMQGFKLLVKLPAVAIIFAVVTSLALLYMPTEMIVLPRYYNSIQDPTTLGLLLCIMAFATSAGSLVYAWFTKYLSYANILRFAILGVAISLLPMSFLPPTWVMLSWGLVLGFAWGPLPPLLNTTIQKLVPASHRGRVFSVEMTIWSAAPMISMVFAGMAVDTFGVQLTFWAVAAIVFIAAVAVSFAPAMKALNAVPRD